MKNLNEFTWYQKLFRKNYIDVLFGINKILYEYQISRERHFSEGERYISQFLEEEIMVMLENYLESFHSIINIMLKGNKDPEKKLEGILLFAKIWRNCLHHNNHPIRVKFENSYIIPPGGELFADGKANYCFCVDKKAAINMVNSYNGNSAEVDPKMIEIIEDETIRYLNENYRSKIDILQFIQDVAYQVSLEIKRWTS